jgi:four helix bundle protein
MRRCVISITSNIAEGVGRRSRKEYGRFILIALGSCAELSAQTEISKELGYITSKEVNDINGKIEEIEKMLGGLLKSLKQ